MKVGDRVVSRDPEDVGITGRVTEWAPSGWKVRWTLGGQSWECWADEGELEVVS